MNLQKTLLLLEALTFCGGLILGALIGWLIYSLFYVLLEKVKVEKE